VPVQDSIVCPDCGAAYQCTAEQQGKLLHCKCGRYLVTGGQNQKIAPAKPMVPAPAKETSTSFGVKSAATAAPTKAMPVVQETAPAIAPAPVKDRQGTSKNLMIAVAAIGIVALLGLAFVLFRPSAMASAAKPVPADVEVAAHPTVATNPCNAAPLRLDNGTSLAHSFLGNGMGRLEIANSMPSDAAVRVVGGADLTIAWIYVQQGQSVTIDNVPLGTHRVLVASGSDWDAQSLTFKCNDVYAEFDKPLEYIDRREDDRTTYSSYKLTLGKQRSSMVSREEFFKGHIGAGH
jgi:hypothetical protein